MSKELGTEKNNQPNIIYILADDLGFGDIGCYNPDSKIPTPNIDKLASQGIKFNDAHSSSAVCTPSRYSILTGRYCWRSNLKRNVLYGYEPPLIESDRMTVASLMKKSGYTTACVGKWHLGLGYYLKDGKKFDFDRPLPWNTFTEREDEEKIDFSKGIYGGPTELGFDYFFGTSGCPTCMPPYAFIENNSFTALPTEYREKPPYKGRPGLCAPGWKHKDADPIFIEKAVEFIENKKDSNSPFFLYLATSAPHEPCVEEVVPEFARGKSTAGHRGDLCWLFDWMVGRVVEALEKTGQAENTLILITSDNGALPGDSVPNGTGGMSDYRTYGHKSCGNWRGYKTHIWEGGHREPLIAKWPNRIPAGTVCDSLVGIFDLLPTCAEITGQKLTDKEKCDSVSILPLLTGDATKKLRKYIIHHSIWGVFAIRKDNWKIVYDCPDSGGWAPPAGSYPEAGRKGQLYDLKNDPEEKNNLWEARRDIVNLISEIYRLET